MTVMVIIMIGDDDNDDDGDDGDDDEEDWNPFPREMLLQPKAPTALVRRSPVTFSYSVGRILVLTSGTDAVHWIFYTELHSIRCVGISFVLRLPCVPLWLLGVSRLFDAIHSNALVLASLFFKTLQCIWLILSVGMDFRFCILHFRWGGSWEAAEESGEGKLLMRVLGGSSMASSVCLYTADHHSSQGSSWYMIIIWWGDEENRRLFNREGRRKLNRIFYLYSWQCVSEHILWWVESLGVFQ